VHPKENDIASRTEDSAMPRDPKSTAQIAGHPLHPMLIPFPVAFLVSTFVAIADQQR
jgi:hypothetical protein